MTTPDPADLDPRQSPPPLPPPPAASAASSPGPAAGAGADSLAPFDDLDDLDDDHEAVAGRVWPDGNWRPG